MVVRARPRVPRAHGDSTLALPLGPLPTEAYPGAGPEGFSRPGGDSGLEELKRVISRLRRRS